MYMIAPVLVLCERIGNELNKPFLKPNETIVLQNTISYSRSAWCIHDPMTKLRLWMLLTHNRESARKENNNNACKKHYEQKHFFASALGLEGSCHVEWIMARAKRICINFKRPARPALAAYTPHGRRNANKFIALRSLVITLFLSMSFTKNIVKFQVSPSICLLSLAAHSGCSASFEPHVYVSPSWEWIFANVGRKHFASGALRFVAFPIPCYQTSS